MYKFEQKEMRKIKPIKNRWYDWLINYIPEPITKSAEEYHDLHLKSDTLLLIDVFENFRKMCLKVYHLDPVKCLSVPGLAWQALKKVKLELLADIDMLLMVEKSIRGGICHAVYWYAKANKKYMKDYDKSKESSYLRYWDVHNLYGWGMP